MLNDSSREQSVRWKVCSCSLDEKTGTSLDDIYTSIKGNESGVKTQTMTLPRRSGDVRPLTFHSLGRGEDIHVDL